jgi:hypothetical protein
MAESFQHFPFHRLGKEVDIKDFLSLDVWKNQKDFIQMMLRPEKKPIGVVLSCVYKCQVDDGIGKIPGRYLYLIYEGDEINTTDRSYAWVAMFDGTLVRIAEHTSITFLKVLQVESGPLSIYRLAKGNVFVYPREKQISFYNIRDSSTLFLPLSEYKVSQAYLYYELLSTTNVKLNPKQLRYAMSLLQNKKTGVEFQLNNQRYSKIIPGFQELQPRIMVILPNTTIDSFGFALDIAYYPGQEAWVRGRADFSRHREDNQIDLYLRKFDTVSKQSISADGNWWRVNKKGSKVLPKKIDSDILLYERLTNYFPTIIFARELILKKMFSHIQKSFGQKIFQINIQNLLKVIQERENLSLTAYLRLNKGSFHPGLKFFNQWSHTYDQKHSKTYRQFIKNTLKDVMILSKDKSEKSEWVLKAFIHEFREKNKKY